MAQIKSYDTFQNVKDHIQKGRILSKGATLTIASGAITVTDSFHLVATEGAADTDDLTTINGGTQAGQILVLMAADDGDTVVVKNNSDPGSTLEIGAHFSLDTEDDSITLMWTGTKWIALSTHSNS
tara:strand:- start:5865 stop:6242 length:378 start_codon:yes stop_codon:yes gene_type:complete